MFSSRSGTRIETVRSLWIAEDPTIYKIIYIDRNLIRRWEAKDVVARPKIDARIARCEPGTRGKTVVWAWEYLN